MRWCSKYSLILLRIYSVSWDFKLNYKMCICHHFLILFLLIASGGCSLPMRVAPNNYPIFYSTNQPGQAIFGYPDINQGDQIQMTPVQPAPPPSSYLFQLAQDVINLFSALSWTNPFYAQNQYYTGSSSSDGSYTSSNYEEPETVSYEDNRIGGSFKQARRSMHEIRFEATRYEDTKYHALITGSLLAVQAGALAAFGHPLISESGVLKLWVNDIFGSENSQQLTDWYTFLHVADGLILNQLLYLIFPNMSVGERFLIATGVEVTWEILENTPFVINRYRETAISQGYIGDSIVNSLSDTVAMMFGFLLAENLHWTAIIVLILAEELIVGAVIRDNLTLNTLNFIHPVDWITRWQEQGKPK